jgi:hypothetical protein
MSHIDRTFYTTDFDGHFPLATAKALPRGHSDHVPIVGIWAWTKTQET